MDSGYNSSSSLNLQSQEEKTGRRSEKWDALDKIFAELDRRHQKNEERNTDKASFSLRNVDKGLGGVMKSNDAKALEKEMAKSDSSSCDVTAWLNLYDSKNDNEFGEPTGGSFNYMRQSSWPVPERTPVQPLHRAQPAAVLPQPTSHGRSSDSSALISDPSALTSTEEEDAVRLEHLKLLFSLPRAILAPLWQPPELKQGGRGKPGCRFCRSNGEQHTFYLSHELKDRKGRISCPVLRAYVCARCGSTGDYAHTLRYCPFSTVEERMYSYGLKRGLRLASGRFRQQPVPEPDPCRVLRASQPARELEPAWAALEQKLNMCEK